MNIKENKSLKELFEKLKAKGIFWSYSKNIQYENFSEDIFIEYVLKYGDLNDIKEILYFFGKDKVRNIWYKNVASDKRFIRTNLLIARIFFDMDIESDYFKGLKNERSEKLKMLASRDSKNFDYTN